MTTDPMTNTDAEPVTVSAAPREYLYFVSYTAMGDFGNCYLPLTFEIATRADVEWVRDELRAQGICNAVVLSFALLPGGLAGR
jgi:hypothetical protein